MLEHAHSQSRHVCTGERLVWVAVGMILFKGFHCMSGLEEVYCVEGGRNGEREEEEGGGRREEGGGREGGRREGGREGGRG